MRANLLSGVSWTGGVSIVRAGLQLAQLAIVTQGLPKTAFAAFMVLQSLLIILAVATEFGLAAMIIVRQIRRKVTLLTIFYLQLVIAAFLSASLMLSGVGLVALTNVEVAQADIALVALINLVMGISHVPFAELQRDLKWRETAITELIWSIVTVVAVFIVIRMDGSLFNALFGVTLGHLARYASLRYSTRGAAWFVLCNPLKLLISVRMMGYFWRFGSFRTGSMLINQFSGQVDIFLIGRLLGPEVLAVYAAAKVFISRIFTFFGGLVSRICLPLLSRQKDHQAFQQLYLNMFTVIVMLTAPCFALLGFNADFVTKTLFSDEYQQAGFVLALLCVVYGIRLAVNLGGQALMSRSAVRPSFYWNLALLPSTVLVIYIASQYGLRALVIALLGYQLFVFVTHSCLLLQGVLRLSAVTIFTRAALLAIGLAVLSLVLVTFQTWVKLTNFSALVFHVLAWGSVFVVSAMYFYHLRKKSQ